MSAVLAAARVLAVPRGPARLLPGRLRGACLRAAVALLLRRNRLDELLARLDGPAALALLPARAPSRPAPAETLAGLRRLPVTCLQRALAGYAALRAAGQEARFVIGVARDGDEVLAHAWLEQGGAPVGEPADPRARFAVAWSHPPQHAPREEQRMDTPDASPEILLTRLADGTGVLLHLGTKFYYTLNRTGVVAWEAISGSGRVDREAILDAIAARFAGVDRARAAADLDALLRDLEAEGLLPHGR